MPEYRSETWPISKLKGWDRNPRAIKAKDLERLKVQLGKHAQFKPVLVTPDGEVIGGNMRLKAMLQMGMEEVWVSVVEPGSETEKAEIALADNDRAGYYLEDEVLALLRDLPDLDASAYAVDFGSQLLASDFLAKNAETAQDDYDPTDVLAREPVTKAGDLWTLGRHTLFCGDSTKAKSYAALMGDAVADMTFTDPPYNVAYEGATKDKLTIMNDKMGRGEFRAFLDAYHAASLPRSAGGIYECMSSSEWGQLLDSFLASGGHFQGMVVWVKNQFTLGRTDYQNQHEPILYGWREGVTNHFFVEDRTKGNVWKPCKAVTSDDGTHTTVTAGGVEIRIPGSVSAEVREKSPKKDVWHVAKPARNAEHPTMKPLALCAEAIRNSSPAEGTVLDPFSGSGSTLIACEQLGRSCYAMELDPRYCDVIIDRWSKETGGTPELQRKNSGGGDV